MKWDTGYSLMSIFILSVLAYSSAVFGQVEPKLLQKRYSDRLTLELGGEVGLSVDILDENLDNFP